MFVSSPPPISKPLLARCSEDVTTRLRLKLRPYYHCIDQQDGVTISVNGKPLIMMSSNEYLGLSSHPRVKQAALEAITQWGISPCGSRMANGSYRYHEELEAALADFLGTEACHVTGAGYLACMAPLTTLPGRNDALLLDKSVHASLWDGALQSGSRIHRFAHEDMDDLASVLASLPADQVKAIAVDGVYSMEGHIASLPRMVELAEQYRALMIVDDSHGFGVIGREGRGTVDHHGVGTKVDVISGSFSKSLASTGGFIASSRTVIDYIRTHCRQIIFSAGLPPSQAAASLMALKVLQEEPEIRQKLHDNIVFYRDGLRRLGVDYWESPSPGIPIIIGDKEKCHRVWTMLWESGFFTVMVWSPAVAAGRELIRTSITAQHSREHITRFLESLEQALKKVGLSS